MNSDKHTNNMREGRFILHEDEPMDGNSHLSRKRESCIIKGVEYFIGDDIKIHIYAKKKKRKKKRKKRSNIRNNEQNYTEEICKINAIDEDFDDRVVILTVYCYWTEIGLWDYEPSVQSRIECETREQYQDLILNKKLRKQAQNYHLFYDSEYCRTIQGLNRFDIIGKVLIVNEYQEFRVMKNRLKQLRRQSLKPSENNMGNILSITDTENAQILDGKYMDVYWCDFVYRYYTKQFEKYESINISTKINEMLREEVNIKGKLFDKKMKEESLKMKKTKFNFDGNVHKNENKKKQSKHWIDRSIVIIDDSDDDIDMDVNDNIVVNDDIVVVENERIINNNFSTIVHQQKKKKNIEIIQLLDKQKVDEIEMQLDDNFVQLSVKVKAQNRRHWLTVEELEKELETVEYMTDAQKEQMVDNCAQFWNQENNGSSMIMN